MDWNYYCIRMMNNPMPNIKAEIVYFNCQQIVCEN